MALIKCPQCGGNVSDKAVKCPHCGCNLGKATIIQHGNRVDAKAMSTAGKIILAVAIVVGSAMCIIPLFTNLYQRGGAPAFDYYLPITYVLMGFGIIAGVLSLGLAINGIIRLCRNKVSTWKYWLLSALFAWISVFVVFGLIVYNDDALADFYYNKIEATKGTYECHLQDGTILSFSAIHNGYGFCELSSHGKVIKTGRCTVDYIEDLNEVGIECFFHKDGVEYGSSEDANENRENLCFEANPEMTILYDYTLQGRISITLKKISNGVKSEEEYLAQIEQNKQAKLEEFKNFRSKDLSAFILHGKVKHVEESYGGNACTIYKFNEQGKLIDVQFDGYSCKIQHKESKLIISYLSKSNEFDYSDSEYEVNSSGRLIRKVDGGEGGYYEESKYSQFDENGWPTYCTNISGLEPDEERTTSHITYMDIDEYGNWTRKAIDGEIQECRTITYYPID